MGLCPDCRSEGETVSYVGASKAAVLGDEDGDDSEGETEESDDGKTICDLCEEEYVASKSS